MADVKQLFDYPVNDERWIGADVQDLAEWAYPASLELIRRRSAHDAMRHSIGALERFVCATGGGDPSTAAVRVAAIKIIAAWHEADAK